MKFKILNKNYGGEVAEAIRNFVGKRAFCIKDKKESTIYKLYGEKEHDGGLKDKNEVKWWVYWTCPKCNHDYSINKIILKN